MGLAALLVAAVCFFGAWQERGDVLRAIGFALVGGIASLVCVACIASGSFASAS